MPCVQQVVLQSRHLQEAILLHFVPIVVLIPISLLISFRGVRLCVFRRIFVVHLGVYRQGKISLIWTWLWAEQETTIKTMRHSAADISTTGVLFLVATAINPAHCSVLQMRIIGRNP
jgi:hypothetical protein